jgi:hypothetical protein
VLQATASEARTPLSYLISAPLRLLQPESKSCSIFIQQYQVEPLDPLGLAI